MRQNNSKGRFLKADLSAGGSLNERISTGKREVSVAKKEMELTKTQHVYKSVVTNIVFTTKWILEHCGKTLKHYEPSLTVEQFSLLQVLRMYHPNPSTINTLKENMLDKNSDVSRLVEKLRKKGWVERHDNERDRRVADVSLTKKGLELLSRLEVEEKRWPEIISGISEEEAEKLNEIMGKISKGTTNISQAIMTIFLASTNLIMVLGESNGFYTELM